MGAGEGELAPFLLELGALVATLALLTRLAGALDISAIPLYLVAGLAFGEGGLVPLGFSEEFVAAAADLGVLLLLFTLGLEFSGDDLALSLRHGRRAAIVDLTLNGSPGLAAGLLLGWPVEAAVLLGGATYISSSGIIARLLDDLGRVGNRETPVVLGLLVTEDLAMAALLPLAVVLVAGQPLDQAFITLAIALAVAGAAVLVAVRYGHRLSRLLAHTSDEAVLLSILGLVLLVGGLAEQAQVSAAVGAFLTGIAVSEPVADRARELTRPLRDLFAATFFVFFGLQIDPGELGGVAVAACALWLATASTKIATGWRTARRAGIGRRGAARAGTALVARGEFSILLAGLGVSAGVEPELGPLVAAYVLLCAISAPLLARMADPAVDALTSRGLLRGSGEQGP
ncbi:MAG TPA: cation:proton antiporter [Solirubrobacteraceae bacterium]|nr:cation:proton antiporter [Solirubrobacteraceae bacterium]